MCPALCFTPVSARRQMGPASMGVREKKREYDAAWSLPGEDVASFSIRRPWVARGKSATDQGVFFLTSVPSTLSHLAYQ